MKFLADMGISLLTVRDLRTHNYDIIHLAEQKLERLPDSEIITKAKQENRTILTFDLDFGDLLAASQEPLPSTIIFRVKQTQPQVITAKLLSILPQCHHDLNQGCLIIIEDRRYRVRQLPIQT